VATHEDVFTNDRCLKPMLPWEEAITRHYIRPITHDGFARYERGEEKQGTGQHGERYSLPGSMAAIRAAIQDCELLESEMKQTWSEDWYSPHILVVCNTIEEACDLAEQTNQELERMGYDPDAGWRATAMVSADTRGDQRLFRPKADGEKRLFHKNDELVHPFMLAKDLAAGRCNRYCARVLFVVDMAIRGMNNWPLLFVVDLKRSGSVIEQVQTAGRLARLPVRLFKPEQPKEFMHFTHPRWYFPESGQESISAIESAWDFITGMQGRVEAGGFIQWSQLLEGVSRKECEMPQGIESPFTLIDRLEVDHQLGTIKTSGESINEQDIERIIDSLPGKMTPDRRERARNHINKVLNVREYRESGVRPIVTIIKPISKEEPK